MRIGIDARAYGWTGIGRYARNLLAHLVRQNERIGGQTPEYVLFTPPQYVREVSLLPHVRVIPVRDSYYSLYEQTGFLTRLLATKVDLVHFVSFNVPIAYRRPFVVTIHDLTRFKFPGAKHRDRFHAWAHGNVFRSAVAHARRIITVSEFTKAELLSVFPSAGDRTAVVYEGVEERFFTEREALREGTEGNRDAEMLARYGIQPPYLLYVGLWLTHKNLPGLLRTFRYLRTAGYQGLLVITGQGRPWDEDIPLRAQREGIADAVRFPGPVTDDILAALYRSADVFLFPSLSEGFGLPPLEAMASGTPVVAARAGSLPEVLGDAALFADPEDPAQIRDAVQRLSTDRELRAHMIERGRERARRFSWALAAERTREEYQRALRRDSASSRIG